MVSLSLSLSLSACLSLSLSVCLLASVQTEQPRRSVRSVISSPCFNLPPGASDAVDFLRPTSAACGSGHGHGARISWKSSPSGATLLCILSIRRCGVSDSLLLRQSNHQPGRSFAIVRWCYSVVHLSRRSSLPGPLPWKLNDYPDLAWEAPASLARGRGGVFVSLFLGSMGLGVLLHSA